MPIVDDVYLGNPNLKKPTLNKNLLKSKFLSLLLVKNDPVYFAKQHVKIVSLDEGLVPFKPYDFQETLIERFHANRFNICKMPRQTGKSTTSVSYLITLCCL